MKEKMSLEEATMKALLGQLDTPVEQKDDVEGIIDGVLVVTDPEITPDEYEEVIDNAKEILEDTPEGEVPFNDQYVGEYLLTCPICGSSFINKDVLNVGDSCPICTEVPEQGFILNGQVATQEDVELQNDIKSEENREENDDVNIGLADEESFEEEPVSDEDVEEVQDELLASEVTRESDKKLEESEELNESKKSLCEVIDSDEYVRRMKVELPEINTESVVNWCRKQLRNGYSEQKLTQLEIARDTILDELNESKNVVKRPEQLNESEEESYERFENGKLIPTGLFDQKSEDILKNVLIQLSDGIWQNTAMMRKYWKYADIVNKNGEIFIQLSRDYNSGFYNMINSDVRKFFAKKIEQIVKTYIKDYKDRNPNIKWDMNCTELCKYLGEDNITIQDAYKVYNTLLDKSATIKTESTNKDNDVLNEIKDKIYWLSTHNKNYTKEQYNTILDIQELVEKLDDKELIEDSKKLVETGEWDDSDPDMQEWIRVMREDAEELAREINGECKSVKGFDAYQGPFAVVHSPKHGDVIMWGSDYEGFYNVKVAHQGWLEGSVAEIAEALNQNEIPKNVLFGESKKIQEDDSEWEDVDLD